MLARLVRLAPGNIIPNGPNAALANRDLLRPACVPIRWLGTKRSWLNGTVTNWRRSVTASTTLPTVPSSFTSRSLTIAICSPLSLKTGVPISLRPRQEFCTLCSEPAGTVMVVAVLSPCPTGPTEGICAAAEAVRSAMRPTTMAERVWFISSPYLTTRRVNVDRSPQ
jgi:hypothetical protein